jgi:hypothetical protein
MELLFGDGTVRKLEGDRVTIGRGPGNDWQIEAQLVSRNHAIIQRSGSGWLLIDMGSNNGTYVNEARVERHRLAVGDELRLGARHLATTATVQAGDDPDPAAIQSEDETIPGYARLESRLDEVIDSSAAHHVRLGQRMDSLEARIDASEQKTMAAITEFGKEVLSLREYDKQQAQEWRRAVAVLFWAVCLLLAAQAAISLGQSVRRNPDLGAAIAEQVTGDELGQLIGVLAAGGIAYITGRGQKNGGRAEDNSMDLQRAAESAGGSGGGDRRPVPGNGAPANPP